MNTTLMTLRQDYLMHADAILTAETPDSRLADCWGIAVDAKGQMFGLRLMAADRSAEVPLDDKVALRRIAVAIERLADHLGA